MKLEITKKIGAGLVLSVGLLFAGQSAAQDKPYVVEGGKVDETTWLGMKIYQRGRCETCHGPDAKGGAAFPSLLEAFGPKALDKAQLKEIVTNGKGTMPPMLQNVMNIKLVQKKGVTEEQAIDALYAYLKGRADGAFPAGNLKKIKK